MVLGGVTHAPPEKKSANGRNETHAPPEKKVRTVEMRPMRHPKKSANGRNETHAPPEKKSANGRNETHGAALYFANNGECKHSSVILHCFTFYIVLQAKLPPRIKTTLFEL